MLQASLSALLHSTGRNVRGNCSAVIIPRSSVVSLPDLRTISNTITTNSGHDIQLDDIDTGSAVWTEVSEDVGVRINFVEKEDITAQGPLFTYTLAFILPNDDFETRTKLLRYLDNLEVIAIVKQRTGQWRLCGNADRGMRLKAELATGTVGNGANEYACALECEQPHRALTVMAE